MSTKLNQREKSLHLRLKALKSITYFGPFCDNKNRLSRQHKQVRHDVEWLYQAHRQKTQQS